MKTNTLNLNNPEEFQDFLHGLIPHHQDDAMGGAYGVKLTGLPAIKRISLDQINTIESLHELKESFNFIMLDYGNSCGDASVEIVNLRIMKTLFQDEAGDIFPPVIANLERVLFDISTGDSVDEDTANKLHSAGYIESVTSNQGAYKAKLTPKGDKTVRMAL